ncbi:hypothetical protein BC830DRAFT_1147421 [Chytriomyces sp. MP71]|nr:hypothetical protein BC830DRAFT_1147421 [Chytriomyces sp. MP71]
MRLPPEGERSTGDSDHSECSRGNSEDPVEGKKERRKQQNRVAQRNYRIKKQARLSELERKFAEVQSGQTGSSINATTADVPAVKAADLTAAERDVLLNQISHLEQENASLQAHVNSCYFMQPPYALPYDPYQYQYQYPQYPTPFFPAVQPMQLFSQPTPFHPQSFTQTHSFSAVALLPAQNKQLPPVTHPVAALPALPQPQLPSIAAKDPQSRAPPLNPMRSDLKLIPGLSSKTHLVDAFCNTIERLFLVGTNSEKKSLTFRIQQMQNEIVDSAASPVDRLKALEVIDASRKKHAHYGVLQNMSKILHLCNLIACIHRGPFWKNSRVTMSRRTRLAQHTHC